MQLVVTLLLTVIAVLHLLFLVLETFLWTHPAGRRVFALTPEQAGLTRKLAANQGLYNGFLAAGLGWAAWSGEFSLALFFLGCVFLAGVFGAVTVSRKIFWVQAFPAMVALLLLFQTLGP